MAFLITLPRLITRFSSAWVLSQSVKSNSFALYTPLWRQIKEAKRSFAKPLPRNPAESSAQLATMNGVACQAFSGS